MDEKLIKFGKITKTHGFEGALVFVSDYLSNNTIRNSDWVFVERYGEKVPYAIEEFNLIDDKKFIAKLTDIDNEENARKIAGSDFYFPADSLVLNKTEEFFFKDIFGWKVFNGDILIGQVVQAVDNNGQILLTVINGGNEYLIPLVDDFLVNIDEEDKVLVLNLPDGLTDMS